MSLGFNYHGDNINHIKHISKEKIGYHSIYKMIDIYFEYVLSNMEHRV